MCVSQARAALRSLSHPGHMLVDSTTKRSCAALLSPPARLPHGLLAGMLCFAGKLVASNPLVAASSYGQGDTYEFNFNTLANAATTLLYMLILNDWPILMEGTVAAVGKSSRLYFIAFWIIVIVVVLNVLVAFVIDSFTTQRVKRELIQQMQRDSVSVVSGGSLGIEDWASLLTTSHVDFSGYRLSRAAHHLDVYDELYKDVYVQADYPYVHD
ncbi:hypothetical protein EON66_03035 [archaeon]|nr:MAG: hypothetical protein EON66_03035 [archaeon]